MKIKLSLIFIVLFATSAFAMDNPWEKKLPFKNATINYTVSGSMNGEKTIYVKDYGLTRAEYSNTTMKVFGMTQKQKEVIITTPDWLYNINLSENTGTKQTNPKKYMLQEFNNLSKSEKKKVAKNAENYGFSMIEGMSGDFQKNAVKILGYKCDKVTMAGSITYTITGTDLALKTQINAMGIKFAQIATNVNKGSVSSSKFKVPSNINIEHNKKADQMMQKQAKDVIQSLLDGTQPEVSTGGSTQRPPEVQKKQNQVGQVSEQDAKGVGSTAKQETKDSTPEEVQKGVKNIFKNMFD